MTLYHKIGSAASEFANLTEFKTYLQGLNGLKEDHVGLLHVISAGHGGVQFSGIDSSAYRVILKPATGASFWHHVSATANRLWYDPTKGAGVSGTGTAGSYALSFVSCQHTISGLMINTSGDYISTFGAVYEFAGKTHNNRYNNCIFENRANTITYPCWQAISNVGPGQTTFRWTNCLFVTKGNTGTSNPAVKDSGYQWSSAEFVNCTFIHASAVDNAQAIQWTSGAEVANCLFVNFDQADVSAAIGTSKGGHNVSTLSTAASTFLASVAPFYGNAVGSTEIVGVGTSYDGRLNSTATLTINAGCAAWAPAVDILNRTRVTDHDIGCWDACAEWTYVYFPPDPGPSDTAKHYPYNSFSGLVFDHGGSRMW